MDLSTANGRAASRPGRETSPVSVASGFGSVMEQERDLQASTAGSMGLVHGAHAAALDRLLRDHQVRLGANVALLEQRYEMLPHPERFQARHETDAPLAKVRRAPVVLEDVGPLPALVAQHLTVLKDIESLIAERPDGRRGELILTKVARNHEDMAWMLTALLRDDESVRDREAVVAGAPSAEPAPGTSERRWENEGGAQLGRT